MKRGVLICVLHALFVGGCDSRELSREQAEAIVRSSGVVSGLESISVKPGAGCIVNLADSEAGEASAFINFNAHDAAVTVDDLLRASAVGVIRGQISETPAERAGKVPAGCEAEWREHFRSAFAGIPHKAISWRVAISERALKAGVPESGGKVLLHKREFVSVTGLLLENPNTATVDYEWEWVPVDVGERMGLRRSGRARAKAMFRKYDDGWRLA